MNAPLKGPLSEEQRSGIGGLVTTLGVVLVLGGANAYWGFREGDFDVTRVQRSEELRVLSQQLAKNSSEAARGNEAAFTQLEQVRNQFDGLFNTLVSGESRTGLPAASADIQKKEIATTKQLWEEVKANADTILKARETVLDLHGVAADLQQNVPQLQFEYEKVTDILVENNAPQDQVRLGTRQIWYAERIVRSIQKVLAGGDDAPLAAENFGHDVDLFGQTLNGMLDGDPVMGVRQVTNREARESLNEISTMFTGVKDNVGYIIQSTGELFKVHEASNKMFAQTTQLLTLTRDLSNAFRGSAGTRLLGNPFVSAGAGVLVVILLILLYITQRRAEKQRFAIAEEAREQEKQQNERNQQAIIRLLDEMGDLADGDLTVNATVTEDFTGAIADSMNFAIDQLRSLVSTVQSAVARVSNATDETRQVATELAQASRNQAQEITGASAAINEMAVSIEQVSANAAESAQVAERSVQIAKNGAEVVRNTIRGMDTIREQIQETSKRIKRLGESSQEIGDIVSLINDIADQTNILALNAAIQAAMAGESGRGFAVVADEVQRLAERSSNATKRIEALVKTIQTDTNEAVISMESSTSEVVRGAKLAQDAGVALEEIERVSADLAELIQTISNAARQQAASAGHVSNTMHVIQEITNQTLHGTQVTAQQIGKLVELADELKGSVAGFKLPGR
ncbi:chemotaxis protein [Permianibacter sp. IMCC34836]|uniref:methyl-accepting chemotaxis protein n=1 Tax=Permianibacter fluminis TaxID=2738515 RepID=UPI0015531661|nr:methyl-accepting chemotaxis protein [Permianibacter fluminis]NQD35801.1 chemotaxis protein [Permianibacter fluminis]